MIKGDLMTDVAVEETVASPTQPGWYRYEGGRQVMTFLLDRYGQWWVTCDNGTHERCEWGYIEQALSVETLVLVAPLS